MCLVLFFVGFYFVVVVLKALWSSLCLVELLGQAAISKYIVYTKCLQADVTGSLKSVFKKSQPNSYRLSHKMEEIS